MEAKWRIKRMRLSSKITKWMVWRPGYVRAVFEGDDFQSALEFYLDDLERY